MPKYKFNHAYKSAGFEFKKGQVFDLDEELAEWINRDSPGALSKQRADRQVKAAKKVERE